MFIQMPKMAEDFFNDPGEFIFSKNMEKKDGERGAELSATEKASAWGSMVYVR